MCRLYNSSNLSLSGVPSTLYLTLFHSQDVSNSSESLGRLNGSSTRVTFRNSEMVFSNNISAHDLTATTPLNNNIEGRDLKSPDSGRMDMKGRRRKRLANTTSRHNELPNMVTLRNSTVRHNYDPNVKIMKDFTLEDLIMEEARIIKKLKKHKQHAFTSKFIKGIKILQTLHGLQ